MLKHRRVGSEAMITSPKPKALLSRSSGKARRIVLTAVGSLGDLHPYIAIALGLKSRGHEAIVAASECYRNKVEGRGAVRAGRRRADRL